MKRIYLDNASTTPLDKEVVKAMHPFLTAKFGNPSSMFYTEGLEAAKALEESREKTANLLGAQKEEIIFTASGTESINLALLGAARANKAKGTHIITTQIEHVAVLEACKQLEKEGFKVTYVKPNKDGLISIKDIENAIHRDTILVSVGHANIEIGTIQPIAEIGKICKNKDLIFHTDAVQSVGQIKVNVSALNVDLLSFSAHKFYGPKGIAGLYICKGTKLKPLIFGGGHEFGLYSGTENVAGAVGLAKALEISVQRMDSDNKRLSKLRDKLIDKTLEKIEDSWLNGSRTQRLPGNANFGFKYVEGESIILTLDMKGIAASTGSACSSKNLKANHVLLALGQKQEYTHGSVRFTLGRQNTDQDVDYVLKVLPGVISGLRKMSPYGKGKDEY